MIKYVGQLLRVDLGGMRFLKKFVKLIICLCL